MTEILKYVKDFAGRPVEDNRAMTIPQRFFCKTAKLIKIK